MVDENVTPDVQTPDNPAGEGEQTIPPPPPAEQPAPEPPPVGTDERAVYDRKSAAFYCPGCGRGYHYGPAECVGASSAPHPPILTVSTDELAQSGEHEHGDPEGHTAAPDTGI